jgi:hypothetical protein
MAATTKTIESVDSDRIRVSGDVTLAEVYEALPSIELFVEPLITSQTLADFVAEGGMGLGTVPVGTFAGQICSLKGVYEGLEYRYGIGGAPLYNTGYPLQRIIEGPNGGLLKGKFEELTEMILRARAKSGRNVAHTAASAIDLPPHGDDDAMFVNEVAARAMGLSGAGNVVAKKIDGAGDDAWNKRFLLDSIPSGQEKFIALTQLSGAKELQSVHAARGGDGLFAAIKAHLGVLVVASASADGVKDLAHKADGLQLTWGIGA